MSREIGITDGRTDGRQPKGWHIQKHNTSPQPRTFLAEEKRRYYKFTRIIRSTFSFIIMPLM